MDVGAAQTGGGRKGARRSTLTRRSGQELRHRRKIRRGRRRRRKMSAALRIHGVCRRASPEQAQGGRKSCFTRVDAGWGEGELAWRPAPFLRVCCYIREVGGQRPRRPLA